MFVLLLDIWTDKCEELKNIQLLEEEKRRVAAMICKSHIQTLKLLGCWCEHEKSSIANGREESGIPYRVNYRTSN